MAMLHPTRDLVRKPQSNLKSSMFPGSMVKNDDSSHPDGKKRQRGQCRSPLWHRNVEDDDLPWAMPLHAGQANAGGGVGSVQVPPNGAKVMLQYDEEDPHILYYTYSPTTDDVHQDVEMLNEDYPSTVGHVDDYGNKSTVNKKQGTITDTHKSGATFFRDSDGNINIYSPGTLSLGAKGGIKIASGGDIQSHASGTHSLKGGSMKLNCSDAAITPTAVGQRNTPTTNNASGQTSA